MTWALTVKLLSVNAIEPTNELSTLLQLIAWCRHAADHYLRK